MADPVYVTAAPTLETLTRLANGTMKVTWKNNADSHTAYTAVYLMARRVGQGLWGQVNSFGYPVISNRQYVQYTKPGGGAFPVNEAWEFMLKAYSVKGKMSPDGNSKSVQAETTKAPTFNTAVRTGPSTIQLDFTPNPDNAATITTTYAFMRPAGSTSALVQVNATTNGAQSSLFVTKLNGVALDGAKAYEIELMSSGPGGQSPRTSRKTAGTWWEVPPGVTDLAGAWQGTASIKLTWTGNPSARGPYNTQEVWRAEGELGQLAPIKTIAGSARTYTDTTAKPAVAYRYEIVPVSPVGRATQRPTLSVAAALMVPQTPNAVTAAYAATDKVKVDWTPRPVTERPYTSQRVLYRLEGTSLWLVAGSVAGTATTFTHTLGGNRVADYAVEAVNAAGSAVSDPVGPVATTPARPATLTAAWTAPTTITVTWPTVATIADVFNLEFSIDNITWYPAPTEGALPARGGTWAHQSVTPTVPHWYRLNAGKIAIAGTPVSSWVLSGVVEALTKPLTPTLVAPEVVDATENIRLAFVHNPVDGTEQTGARVRFRKQGTTTWTTRTLTTADFTTITAGTYTNGDVLEVQAETAGGTGEYSGYSTTMLVALRARPVVGSVTNSAPTSPNITTTWTATGQTSAVVELLNSNGQAIQSRTVSAAVRSVVWTGLTDQASYNTRVTASDQYQKSLPVTSDAFTIVLVRPGKPSASAEFREDRGDVLITAVLGVNTARAEVWRDGAMVGNIASGVFVDDHPPLGNTPVVYTVRAYGTEGGFIDSDPVTVSAKACDVYLTYNGQVCRAGWEPSFAGVAGRESVAHRYVGDTNGPSFTWGRTLDRTLDCAITIHTDTGDTPLSSWIEASEHPGAVTYRDPSGRVLTGAISAFRFNDSTFDEQQVSFTITQGKGNQ